MKFRSLFSVILILVLSACVDRITFDVGGLAAYSVVVDGVITDQPGPYQVELTKSFDIESKNSTKTNISARKVVLSDNLGNEVQLKQIRDGVYQTDPDEIRGVVGRAYKIRVELLDGRIYESIPDTLQSGGTVDSVYYTFKSEKNSEGTTKYGFDVFFNSTSGEKNSYYFLWKFVGTYQVTTNPEAYTEPCGESRCPRPRPCSGYVLNVAGELEQVGECTCCTCWVEFYNDNPIVSDNQLVAGGSFKGVRLGYVPLNQWTFQDKVRAEAQQYSLSRRAFNFWRAVKAQKEGTTSLFQPISGKIASNFVQLSGKTAPMEGIFYASALKTKGVFIPRSAVPNTIPIPPVELPYNESCQTFPNSSNARPSYWTY